jgi:hypothetical protein
LKIERLRIEDGDPQSSIVAPRIPLEQPNHPITEPIVDTEAGAAAHGKINRRGDKNEIVAQAHFVSVVGLSVKRPKIVLRLLVFDRSFHHRRHGRQYFQPVPMKAEGRDQKDNDHQRADGCLNSRGDAETAHDHQEGSSEAKESRTLGKENARGIDRIGPAPHVTEPAYQHAPT